MKRILLALCAIVILLSGCNSDKTDMVTKSEQDLVGAYIPEEYIEDLKLRNADDSWKYEVAERLYEEMCYFYDNMEEHEIIEMAKKSRKYVNRNEVSYNCVMAVDRGCGIGQVYYKYLSEEKVNDVLDKLYNLEYVDYFSGVSFGYMENGMHFIAIYPKNWEYGTVSDDAKNKIRNLTDEMNFLYEFSDNSEYFMADVYAEDLSGQKEDLTMNLKFVARDEPFILDMQKVDILSEGTDVIEKYNRSYISTNESVKAETWNLFAFEKEDMDLDLFITTPEGNVELLSVIPINNLFYK